jgi:protein involved in polysaccharide export with SLBB domain
LSQNLTDTRLNDFPITGEEYVSGDDGIIRIYVNIWGHVKYPGTYLVYDGINVVNAISLAGGPSDGADLKKILLRSAKNSDNKTINLEEKVSSVVLSPFDTIMVQEKLSNKILTRSSLIGALFQLINLVYTIENLNND